MTVRMVDSGNGIPAATQLVIDALRRDIDVEMLDLRSVRVPRSERRRIERDLRRFSHTPEPLVRSWEIAAKVLRATRPGDVVVFNDRGGPGGVFAQMQTTKPVEQQRSVWTVAGDGFALETMLVAGTIEHVEMPIASAIDWELVQYRESAVVLAAAAAAAEILAELGVNAHLVDIAEGTRGVGSHQPVERVRAPGPVSRRNRSGDVLRAAASIPSVSVIVSETDVPDLVWNGTTWDSLGGVRAVLGDRVRRTDEAGKPPDIVVLGDPLVAPDREVAAWRDAGVRITSTQGSVAAGLWNEIDTWETVDDLAELLGGAPGQPRPVSHVWDRSLKQVPSDSSRARRVSVGVPVFRNITYLDACLDSIVNQSEPPFEVLVIDDGSESAAVGAALALWTERAPHLIRVLSQSNRGVCVARNRMIDAMLGDAFVLVDQDDTLDTDFIRTTAQALRNDRSLWAAATWTEFFGDYQGIEAKPPFDQRVGMRENPIVSTAALVDMRVRAERISFAPDLAFLYCEDWHYWSQIVAAGGRVGLVPEPLVRHRVHQASGGFQRTELAHQIGTARATGPLRCVPDPANASEPRT